MRRLLPLVLVALVAAACGGAKQERLVFDPTVLPDRGGVLLARLPEQGLVVETSSGVALVGLDGHVLKRLPGFHLYPRNGGTHDFVIQNLDQAGPTSQPRLVGPGDRWYTLEVRVPHLHLLEPLDVPRIWVATGLELVARPDVGKDGSVGFKGFVVQRDGRTVYPLDRTLRLVPRGLVQTRGRLVTLATGASRPVPQSCYIAGVRSGTPYAACQRMGAHPRVDVVRIDRGGARHVLTTLPRLYVDMAALSPDGRSVAVHASPGCGGGYVFLVPTAGGSARLVSGGRFGVVHAPYSQLLGWSADGRVVVHIEPPSCEGNGAAGTYLVDPHTLKRTRITSSYGVMWNPFPR